MHAAIFDIDGTLLESDDVDGALYIEAVTHVLGNVRIRDAWEQYSRVTDAGVLAEICEENDLVLDAALSLTVMREFVGRLSAHVASNGPFREVPGALRYLSRLRQRQDVRVAYATGAWRESARLKLSSAGFPLQGIPLASSDDHPDRKQIMLHALSQLDGSIESVTYFGDAVWDLKATSELGWAFVPVGRKLGGITDFSAASADLTTAGETSAPRSPSPAASRAHRPAADAGKRS
jgi:beta-phosphoglucomutase-like phosphatase (HAD superfamily)